MKYVNALILYETSVANFEIMKNEKWSAFISVQFQFAASSRYHQRLNESELAAFERSAPHANVRLVVLVAGVKKP